MMVTHAHRRMLSGPSAAVLLVLLAGGANVLRDLIVLTVGIKLGPLWDPTDFVR